ncbi:DUF3304 domain-containing protein [Paludibacterium denitrificans]|uniref:DUF3304 domain-containing protein n=1 Tax=Paludibacterium denitrificans TaxID=2675226 RepID=A0A844GBQ5_9NEIS|nr:DUF3304 domain-containing protein [Paludibacterium denitrificans]MTD33069.1 DUF3304 domain-containing protein [Paludibacterium denitrificans]
MTRLSTLLSQGAVSLLLLLIVLTTGCQGMAKDATTGIDGRVVNADKSIHILWARMNGSGVSGSGGDECCMSIPAKWRPGMTAEITWKKDPSPGINPDGSRKPNAPGSFVTPEWSKWMDAHEKNYRVMKKTIFISKYDDICKVNFVFLPCDDPRVIIDCDAQNKLFQNMPGGQNYDPELIRRLGGQTICQKPA